MKCCHYTTMQGLLGIMTNKSIWATNIGYLNDSSEFYDALISLRKFFAEVNKPKDGTISQSEFDEFRAEILEIIEELCRESRTYYYSISFSRDCDSLSQWRAYGNGVHGYGIIFDIKDLIKSMDSDYSSALIKHEECVYVEKDKSKSLRNMLNELHRYRLKNSADDYRRRARSVFSGISLAFKNESFRDEAEVRIIVDDIFDGLETVQFRAGAASLIPYKNMSFGLECIKGFVVGPTIDADKAKNALIIMVKSLRDKKEITKEHANELLNNVAISSVPYINW